MNSFVRILGVALLAQLSSQSCVDETLNCNQPVPTIYKLGYQSCNCDSPDHAGALKYAHGRLYLCVDTDGKFILGLKPTTVFNPTPFPRSSPAFMEKAPEQ